MSENVQSIKMTENLHDVSILKFQKKIRNFKILKCSSKAHFNPEKMIFVLRPSHYLTFLLNACTEIFGHF